jgi:hypothetical protein
MGKRLLSGNVVPGHIPEDWITTGDRDCRRRDGVREVAETLVILVEA